MQQTFFRQTNINANYAPEPEKELCTESDSEYDICGPSITANKPSFKTVRIAGSPKTTVASISRVLKKTILLDI